MIAQGLEDAKAASEARANAENEANKILNEAQAKAAEVIREATTRAESVRSEIKSLAEAEASKAREEALAEVQAERDLILGQLRGQVASLAIAAAQKLVGEALDEKRQRALLDEFFSGVRSGKVVVLENASLGSGSAAEVVSALPLSPTEQNQVKQEVVKSLGGAAEVQFKVDPAILGGLIVRVGDRMIDGSVIGQLDSLKQSLR
jgi:F-type H+-transporting ATPase subunit b